MERDGEMTWNEALTKFECHHDLLPIMGDRASSQPEFTNSNRSDSDADSAEQAEAVAEDNANVWDNALVAEQPVPSADEPAHEPADRPPSKKGRSST